MLFAAAIMLIICAIATVDVFVQTSDYDRAVAVEASRLNRMAALSGDPLVDLDRFRELLVERNLTKVGQSAEERFGSRSPDASGTMRSSRP